MHKFMMILAVSLIASLVASGAMAQGKKTHKKTGGKKEAAAKVEVSEANESSAASVPESSFDMCQDGVDNDLDNHIDCDDQDCEIYAMCIREALASAETEPEDDEFEDEGPVMIPGPRVVAVVHTKPLVERGHMCSDGSDNDNDGLIDCFDKDCHRTWYCRRQIYYVPEPKDKAPGLLVSIGGGLALPNFRGTSEPVESGFHGEIPFDQDMGLMAQLKLGYLPLPWLGFGVNLQAGVTASTNREETDNNNEDAYRYKYEALKGFSHVGGFVRLQYPTKRFVPYLDIAGGYSYVYQRWWIYDGDEDWANIDDGDVYELEGTREIEVATYRHFTLALEPGFDVYVRKRSVAVGLRAWLPVWSSSHARTDNTGVMFNVTVTPMWRERARLKPEYENPAATVEEEMGLPEPEAEYSMESEFEAPISESDSPAGEEVVAAGFTEPFPVSEEAVAAEKEAEGAGGEAAVAEPESPGDDEPAIEEDPYADPAPARAEKTKKKRKSRKEKKDK